LNFVTISKASGTQTTDLKVGLPTFTLGPAQAIAAKQFQFAGNSWDNSSNGSFDSAPLASHDFYANMMSPIALETASALIHMGYSRELMLNTVISGIRVEGGGHVDEYRNDPLNEPSAAMCPDASEFYGPNGYLNGSPYAPEARPATDLSTCEYHLFQFYLQAAMTFGFNIQVKSVPNPAYTPDAVKQAKTAGKDPPSKTITAAQFCFDPAFTRKDLRPYVMMLPDRCGATSLEKKGTTTNQQTLTVVFQGRKGKSVPLAFTIKIRSSFAAFSYFGHLLRAYETTQARLYWPDRLISNDDVRNLQILSVTQSVGPCFASTYLNASLYCVPSDAGDTTKQVFSMLSQLVALNTTTGSLPTTLEVRLQ
jgi:hypothetical protein